MAGEGARVWVVGLVLGAQGGEIPAASAGMTELSCGGVTEGVRGYDGALLRGCDGRGGVRVWVVGTVLGAQGGEIPAASAGMTELSCAGVTGGGVRVGRRGCAGRTEV